MRLRRPVAILSTAENKIHRAFRFERHLWKWNWHAPKANITERHDICPPHCCWGWQGETKNYHMYHTSSSPFGNIQLDRNIIFTSQNAWESNYLDPCLFPSDWWFYSRNRCILRVGTRNSILLILALLQSDISGTNGYLFVLLNSFSRESIGWISYPHGKSVFLLPSNQFQQQPKKEEMFLRFFKSKRSIAIKC